MFSKENKLSFGQEGTQIQQNPFGSLFSNSNQNKNSTSSLNFAAFLPQKSIVESEYIPNTTQPQEKKKIVLTQEEIQSDLRTILNQKQQKEILEAKKNKVLRQQILNEDNLQNQLKNPILKKINDQINKIFDQTEQILRLVNNKEDNYLFPFKIETINEEIIQIKKSIQKINNTSEIQQKLNNLGYLCWKTSSQLSDIDIEIKRFEKLLSKENEFEQFKHEDNSSLEQEKKHCYNKRSLKKLDDKINILNQLFEGFNDNFQQFTEKTNLKDKMSHIELKNNLNIVHQDISTQCFNQKTLNSKIDSQIDKSSEFSNFSTEEVSFNILKNLISKRMEKLKEILKDLHVNENDISCQQNKNKNKSGKRILDLDIDDFDADENEKNKQQNGLNENSNDYNLLNYQQMMNKPIKGKNIKFQNPTQTSQQFKSAQQQQNQFEKKSNKRVIQLDLDDDLSDSHEEIQLTESAINPSQTQNSFLKCESSLLHINSCINGLNSKIIQNCKISSNIEPKRQKNSFDPIVYKIQQSIPSVNEPHNIKYRQNMFTILKNKSKKQSEDSNIYKGEQHYNQKMDKKYISQNRLTTLQYEQLTETLQEEKIKSINIENQQKQKISSNLPSKNPLQQVPPNITGLNQQNANQPKINDVNNINSIQQQSQNNSLGRMVTSINQGKSLQTKNFNMKKTQLKQADSNESFDSNEAIPNPLESDSDNSDEQSGFADQGEEEYPSIAKFQNILSLPKKGESKNLTLQIDPQQNRIVSQKIQAQEKVGEILSKNDQTKPEIKEKIPQVSDNKGKEIKNNSLLINLQPEPLFPTTQQPKPDAQNKQQPNSLFQQSVSKPQDKKQDLQNLLTKPDTQDSKTSLFSVNQQQPQQNISQQQLQTAGSKLNQQTSSQVPQDKQKQQPIQIAQQQQKQNTKPQQNTQLFAALPPDSPPLQAQIAKLPPDSPTEVKLPSDASKKAEEIQKVDQSKATLPPKENEQNKQNQSLFGGQNSSSNKSLIQPLTTENKPKNEENSQPQTKQSGGLFGQQSGLFNKNAPTIAQPSQKGLFQTQPDSTAEKQKTLFGNITSQPNSQPGQIGLSNNSLSGLVGNSSIGQGKGLFDKSQAPEAKADIKPPAAPAVEADNSTAQQSGFNLKTNITPGLNQDSKLIKQTPQIGQGISENKGLFGNMTIGGPNNQNQGIGMFGQKDNTNTSQSGGLFNFTNKTDNKQNTNQQNDDLNEKNDVNKKKKLSTENNQTLNSNLNNMNQQEFSLLNIGGGTANNNPSTAPFSINEKPNPYQQQPQLGGGLFNTSQPNMNQPQNPNSFLGNMSFGGLNSNSTSLFGQNPTQSQNSTTFGNTGSLFANNNSNNNMFGFNQNTPQGGGITALNPQGITALQKPAQSNFGSSQNNQFGFGTGNTQFGQSNLGGNQQNNNPFKSDLSNVQFGNINPQPQQQQQQQQTSGNMFSGFMQQQGNGLLQTSGQPQGMFGNSSMTSTPNISHNSFMNKPRK